jgi:6-methylsalicylate decarboxylase
VHLALMDEAGIDKAILSVSSPGIHFGDDELARDVARHVNDVGTSTAGYSVMSNAGGVYLGDHRYDPLWQALNSRRTTLFVHPPRLRTAARFHSAARSQ